VIEFPPVPGAVQVPPGPKASDPRRRTRMAPGLDPQLRGWLVRAVRGHAHIATVVRLFGAPGKAGGQSNHGETYAERAARGDRTLLYDCVSFVVDEMTELRNEIAAVMDSAPPTTAAPGTPEKVAEMVRRAETGHSLFIPGDADTNTE
jgi:hypothetical protein